MPAEQNDKRKGQTTKLIGRDLEWARYDDLVIPVAKRDLRQADIGVDARYLNIFDPGPSPCLKEADPKQVLAEGDSWFCLSIYGNQTTMVQHLSKMGYAVTNVSRYSRTLAQVFARRDDPTGYRERLKSKPKALLLSAGGNDFLGETILTWLDQRSSNDHDPANAKKYVNQNFTQIMGIIKYTYAKILEDVADISPNTRVILQTYTYGAVPTYDAGMHLGRYFMAKSFEPTNPDHRALIDAIVKLLLDRFYRVLLSTQKSAKVTVDIVDFRKALSSSDMRDEIHPKSKMAPVMAQAYVPFLKAAGVEPQV